MKSTSDSKDIIQFFTVSCSLCNKNTHLVSISFGIGEARFKLECEHFYNLSIASGGKEFMPIFAIGPESDLEAKKKE